MSEVEDPKKMKVADLKLALEKRGLDSTGLKADLSARLQEALDEEEFGLGSDDKKSGVPSAEEEVKEEEVKEEEVKAPSAPSSPAKKTPSVPSSPTKTESTTTTTTTAKTESTEEEQGEKKEHVYKPAVPRKGQTQEEADAIVAAKRAAWEVKKAGFKEAKEKKKLERAANEEAAKKAAEEQKAKDEEFEKIKAKRAERFGIPVFVKPVVAAPVGKKEGGNNNNNNNNNKRKNSMGDGNNNNNNNKNNNKKQKQQQQQQPAKPKKSKEELEQLLARAIKYNTGNVESLKAELRSYKF